MELRDYKNGCVELKKEMSYFVFWKPVHGVHWINAATVPQWTVGNQNAAVKASRFGLIKFSENPFLIPISHCLAPHPLLIVLPFFIVVCSEARNADTCGLHSGWYSVEMKGHPLAMV